MGKERWGKRDGEREMVKRRMGKERPGKTGESYMRNDRW